MSSAPGMCQTYPDYTSGAPEDVSTALHGSGEGSLCTQVHASCGIAGRPCNKVDGRRFPTLAPRASRNGLVIGITETCCSPQGDPESNVPFLTNTHVPSESLRLR